MTDLYDYLYPMKKMNEAMQRAIDPMYDINKSLNFASSVTNGATASLRAIQPIEEFNKIMESITNPFGAYEKMMEDLDPMKKLNQQMEAMFNPFPDIYQQITSFESIANQYAKQQQEITNAATYLQESINSICAISSLQKQAELFVSNIASYKEIEEALSASAIQNFIPSSLNNIMSSMVEREYEHRTVIESIPIADEVGHAVLLQELQNMKDEILDSLNMKTGRIEEKLEMIYFHIISMKNPLLLAFFVTFIFPVFMNILSSALYDSVIKPELTLLTNPKQQHVAIRKEVIRNVKVYIKDTEQRVKYRIVTTNVLNVRAGKTIKSQIIAFTFFGEIIEIVRRERNWCLIKRYDKESETYIQGWVSTRYLAQIR